jgi:tetratricopeptide (TPR) repeat protein
MDQSFYKQIFHCGLLALIIFICYSNTLESSWHFDDIPNIVSNQNNHAQNLSWKELKKSFYSPDTNKLSRPVANLTFAINYYFSGLNTRSYHIINIFIHITASWFAYLLFRNTLQLYLSNNHRIQYVTRVEDIALLGAVLWAIHPIQTQAVTYIVQRMTSLAAMFCMMAFYFYLRFRKSDELVSKTTSFVIMSFCFLLALGSKENAILLPITVAGYEVAFFRTSFFSSKKYSGILILLILLILTFLFLPSISDKLSSVFEVYQSRTFTPLERLLTQPFLLLRYIFLIFYPLSNFLVLETDIIAFKGLFDPFWALLPILFITSLFLFGIVNLKKFPLVSFAIFYYFVGHLIESSVIPLELYFEHRNYLPSLFIFFALSYYLFKLIHFYKVQNKTFIRNLIIFGLMIILIGEGNGTYLRNDVWQDEITLHTDTINKFPDNPRPYVAIAVEKITANQYDDAIEFLQKAESLHKKYPERFQANWIAKIYYNAGLVFKKRNDNEKAIQFFTRAIYLNGFEWAAHANLGILYFEKGDYIHAEDFLFNAVQLHGKSSPRLYNYYGRVLYTNEKYNEAIKAFRTGLELYEMRSMRYNLAATYLKKGDLQKAKAEIFKIRYDVSRSDLIYYLYYALFYSGEDRNRSLKKIASMLVANKNDYCEWISSIINNNSLDIIFPCILNFKDQLDDAYLNELVVIKNQIAEQIRKVEECNVTAFTTLE